MAEDDNPDCVEGSVNFFVELVQSATALESLTLKGGRWTGVESMRSEWVEYLQRRPWPSSRRLELNKMCWFVDSERGSAARCPNLIELRVYNTQLYATTELEEERAGMTEENLKDLVRVKL